MTDKYTQISLASTCQLLNISLCSEVQQDTMPGECWRGIYKSGESTESKFWLPELPKGVNRTIEKQSDDKPASEEGPTSVPNIDKSENQWGLDKWYSEGALDASDSSFKFPNSEAVVGD